MVDNIARAIAISAKGLVVNVRDFGARGNGVDANGNDNIDADDTEALKACALYVRKNISKVSGIYFPPGVYICNLEQSDTLFYINGSKGLHIEASGAIIRRKKAFDEDRAATIFQFDNSRNITASGPIVDTHNDYKIVDLSTEVNGTNRGYQTFNFVDNNYNIRLLNQEVYDNFRIANFQGRTDDTVNENIVLHGRAIRCEYGATFQGSGNHANVQLYGELCHRVYYPHGVVNHEILIHSRSPRTVTAMLGAEHKDTVGIRGSIFIEYTDDPAHLIKKNGGVEFYPVARPNKTARGHLRDVKLRVVAITTGNATTSYRPVVSFGCNKYTDATLQPGRIINVELDIDIEGWRGDRQYRPPVGFIEVTGYDVSGTPTFSVADDGTNAWQEPELENITIKARIHTPNISNRKNSIEMSMSKLTGTFKLDFDGNMSPSVRNLGPTGKIIMTNINCHRGSGIVGNGIAALDHMWIQNSNNHLIDHLYEEQVGSASKPATSKVNYLNHRYINFTATPSGSLTVNIPLVFVKPENFYYYRMSGHSSGCNYEGILEVRHDGGVFIANTRIIRWAAWSNNTPTVAAPVTPSIIRVNGGESLTLQLAAQSPILAADMNYARIILQPYET